MAHQIIDLTHPLDSDTLPFPGDPPPEFEIVEAIPAEHPEGQPGYVNTSALSLSLHTGTHLDAPFHFWNRGTTVDLLPLEHLVGLAMRIDLSHKSPRSEVTRSELEPYHERMQSTRKVLLDLGWACHWGTSRFFEDFPVLSPEAARFLVECGVHLLGTDIPSLDVPPNESHFILLGHEVVVLENLTNLNLLPAEGFDLIALPLKIVGREASPVRVVALVESASKEIHR